MSAHCSGVEASAPTPKASADGRLEPLVALIGRPNSGKSSLFNAVTGGRARVGNFPGITVDILETRVALGNGLRADLADLPGLYSLQAVVDPSTDEGVARHFIEQAERSTRPFALVQVIDATQLALGLRLTRELTARAVPMLVVVTQRDMLDAEGRTIDVLELERALGARVLLVSAREATTQPAVLAALGEVCTREPRRALPHAAWDPNEVAARVLRDLPDAPRRGQRSFTARADALLLHPFVGPVLFVTLMAAVFAGVFLIADPVTAGLDAATGFIGAQIKRAVRNELVASFLTDGVLGGAGTVLVFMPQIVVLSVALELLEASGYLSRGAFLVDRLLNLLGLSGRSFFPLLMGHACAVPAIIATRIIRNPKERLTAILILPLMTCSARLPTYALLLGTFFAHRSPAFRSLLFVFLYFAGIASGLIASFALRRTATRGRALPLVIEMPAYRAPQLRVVARKGAQSAWQFLRYVGTSILGVALVLWALLAIPMPGHRSAVDAADRAAAASVTDAGPAQHSPIEWSVAASVGRALEPITSPVGFDWRVNVGLIASFGARELMVGTMGVIFGVENAGEDPVPLSQHLREAKRADGRPLYSTRTALALLAFFVFACQCMSTVVAIRRETRSWRWPGFVLAYTYALAYGAAFVVYRVGGLLGIG